MAALTIISAVTFVFGGMHGLSFFYYNDRYVTIIIIYPLPRPCQQRRILGVKKPWNHCGSRVFMCCKNRSALAELRSSTRRFEAVLEQNQTLYPLILLGFLMGSGFLTPNLTRNFFGGSTTVSRIIDRTHRSLQPPVLYVDYLIFKPFKV